MNKVIKLNDKFLIEDDKKYGQCCDLVMGDTVVVCYRLGNFDYTTKARFVPKHIMTAYKLYCLKDNIKV